MSEIYGQINIQFDTDNEIKQEDFTNFKNRFEKEVMEFLEDKIYDLGDECNIRVDSFHPCLLDDLYLD